MTPPWVTPPWLTNDSSLPFLPATPSSPPQNLEGLFELTLRPLRALDSPLALLPDLQRCKDIVIFAGAEVPVKDKLEDMDVSLIFCHRPKWAMISKRLL